MAAIVVLAKAPAASLRVPFRTRELARWLGCTESYVAHTVLPELRARGILTSQVETADSGEVTGLALRLEPLREARADGGGHPLALTRQDLATLLRLCEAVVGPGWEPKDGPVTPPGLLAEQTGKGAATDRLALLMLVLQSRPDGRARLVGGSVAAGRGRADATVAKLLGCSVSGGGKVVDRLGALGLVEVPRVAARSGCFGRSQLVVPDVRAAWAGNEGAAAGAAPVEAPVDTACSQCSALADGGEGEGALPLSGDGWEQTSFDALWDEADDAGEGSGGQRPGTEVGDLDPGEVAESRVIPGAQGLSRAAETGVVDRPAAADLHTTHTPVVEVSGSSAGDLLGFSGSAAGGDHRLPERAHRREDERDDQAVGAASAGGRLGGPLRGEQRISGSGTRLGRSGRDSVFVHGAGLPQDLADVLGPVAWLWPGVGRTSTSRWLAGAVRTELARLRGLMGEEDARRAVAERLERRVRDQAGRPVQDLVGWVLTRGLPQRPGCWSAVCDDRVRMDTGGPCASCDTVLGDRRAVRQAVAAEIAAELPRLSGDVRRGEVERRLNHRVQVQAATDSVRRERELAERAEREAAWERRREELAAQEAARAQVACVDCGVPRASGLCPTCTFRGRVEVLVGEAVDLVVALHGEVTSSQQARELSERVEADTRALIERGCTGAESGEPAVLAFTAATVAQQIADGRRRSVLARLERCEEADAEAERAFEATMRRRQRFLTVAVAREAAEEAAATARQRAAQSLLAEFLDRLQQVRGAAGGGEARAGWRSRCADLAGRALPGETQDLPVLRQLEAAGAVSAA
ncbi:hypothetical protein ACIQU4_28430 [Streptomyces sp. NPDC090741]|uniref:hypothetical protein n=1 Tax=Streptomyces sp. NPDC090741 TaxID=3365967 RepID=UPI0037F9A0F6